MLKLSFLQYEIKNNSQQERMKIIANKVAPMYGVTPENARISLQRRYALGSVMVANDIDLPHIEVNDNIQGLVLIVFNCLYQPSFYSLVLIVNPLEPSEKIKRILGNLLIDESIYLLKTCNTQNSFLNLIKEMDYV